MVDNVLEGGSSSLFARLRYAVVDVLAAFGERSQSMRCLAEAERLSALSDGDLYRLGVRREDIVRRSFRSCTVD